MESENIKFLKDSILDAGYEIRDYSGRAMYGKKCLAFTTDNNIVSVTVDISKTIADKVYSEDDNFNIDKYDAVLDFLSDAKTDSMGRGIVIYFPSIGWDVEWEDN